MKKTLIDNSSERLSMLYAIKQCMKTEGIRHIRIATGYWDLLGTALVAEELEQFLSVEGNKLELLIGKDPYVYAQQLKHLPEGCLIPKYPDDFIRKNIEDLDFTEENLNVVSLLTKYCKGDNPNLEIKLYQENDDDTKFLHSKCFIFSGQKDDGEKWAYGIIGSSNFTRNGIKFPEGNAELNYLENEEQFINHKDEEDPTSKGHIQWFEEKWRLSKAWTEDFLLKVLGKTPIYTAAKKHEEERIESEMTPLTPYELYIKYLQTQYGYINDVTTRQQLMSYLPASYNSFDFQMEAVEQCFKIMTTYNGFMLSDVVGLGKTIVAILVIRKFLAEADFYGCHPKVLVVTPPAIKSGWEKSIREFDEGKEFKISRCVDFITTGSIGNLCDDVDSEDVELTSTDNLDGNLKIEDYGLIIIDESHNFRNSETQKYKALEALIDGISLRGKQPFVGLLSATPQNNTPRDLKNQIYLFEREPNRSKLIDDGKLATYFTDKEDKFDSLRNDNSPEARAELKQLANDIYVNVLSKIVVRRTRTDIKQRHEKDAENLHFPTIIGPNKLEYQMDGQLVQLFNDTVTAILPPAEGKTAGAKHIGYYRYAAITYLTDEQNKKTFEKRNLTVEGISKRLAHIMQLLLVKRLESSFAAFMESLGNLLQYTRNMIEMIQNNQVFICQDIDVNKQFADCNYDFGKVSESITRAIKSKGGKNRMFHADDFAPEYLALLKEDEKLIEELYRRWADNKLDPKMNKFMLSLQTEMFNPEINNPSGLDTPKLVIFTEAKATQRELTRFAESLGHKVLSIDASNRKEKEEEIRENFDANSEIQKNDYDIIITTEVLAEGVNLHRSNVILNYDTPWNATRLMQRIGRVNRIGSKEKYVHVFNFFPTTQSNNYIKLIEKAYAKLQSFHTMFGEDSKVFSEMEEVGQVNYDRQFDGEESPETKYIKELMEYRTKYPERYAWLCSIKSTGIQLQPSPEYRLYVVNAENGGEMNICIDANDKAQVVSSTTFMAMLKTSAERETIPEIDENENIRLSQKAIEKYQMETTHVIANKDLKKQQKTALGVIKSLNGMITSDNARQALANARQAVDNGNKSALNIVLKLGQDIGDGQLSLFGLDNDIDTIVESLFKRIASESNKKTGVPFVSMFEI